MTTLWGDGTLTDIGGGKRFFPNNGVLMPLRLVASEMVSTGAVLATYAPIKD